MGLALIACWWIAHRQPGVPLVDIDHAAPIEVQYQVELNEADWPELLLLPSIGPKLAKRIVAYREEQGPFESTNELTQVPGIGPKTLEKIAPYINVP